MSNRMLARLGVIYGQPDSHDPVAYLEELTKLLSGFSDSVLDKATEHLLKNHRGRNWPTPAECVKACHEVQEPDRAAKARQPEADRYPDWTHDAISRANKLIQSELGRRAAREGWITSLWDYCRKCGALPDSMSAIHRCKVDAQEFDEAYASVCRGEGDPGLNAALRRLGDSMLERRAKLSAIALGDTA